MNYDSMSYEQFKAAVESVRENGFWSDWYDWLEIEQWIGTFFTDVQAKIIERAIESNGATLDDDMQALEREVWGFNFARGGV